MSAHVRHHHHAHHRPPRSRGGSRAALLSSAGALAALVAVAAMAGTASASPPANMPTRCGGEARHTINEGKAVRAVAAAMAQAARELAGGGERLVHALPLEWSLDLQPALAGVLAVAHAIAAPPARSTLRESLLDLPPPGC